MSRRPTFREIALAPLKYRVERSAAGAGYIAYHPHGFEAECFDTLQEAFAFAFAQVSNHMEEQTCC